MGDEVRVRPWTNLRPVYTGVVEHVHAFADGRSVLVRRGDGVLASAHVYDEHPHVSDEVDTLDLVAGFLLVEAEEAAT